MSALRAIVTEQARSPLDDVTRELLQRTGAKVSVVTVREALRQQAVEKPTCRTPRR